MYIDISYLNLLIFLSLACLALGMYKSDSRCIKIKTNESNSYYYYYYFKIFI